MVEGVQQGPVLVGTFFRSPNVCGMTAALPLRGKARPTRTTNWWTC